MALVKVKIGSAEINLNKNEAKEAQRIATAKVVGGEDYAQRAWDIWARSAPNPVAQWRRKEVARALGLSDEIKFL